MTQSFRDKVLGSWTLIEYSRTDEEGNKFYPFGKDASGFLNYTNDGYMSAQLMAQGRKEYSLNKFHEGTPEEMAEAALGYHAYSGKFEVDEEHQTIYHHMEVALIPNRLGQVQDRRVEMDGDVITIYSQWSDSTIIWRKSPDNSNNIRA